VAAVVEEALPARAFLARLVVPVAAFGAVVVAGIGGFVVLAHVSVVEATFWLFDPASISIHGEGEVVKAYAVFVYSGLVLTGLWTGETVVAAAFGGQIRRGVRRVQNDRKLERMTDHVVVCGYGIFGRTVAGELVENDVPVVAVERDAETFERIESDAVVGLHADARLESTLRDAGVERSRAVVAAIDDSNVNIQIAIVASELAPDVHVVVRVGDELYEDLARRAGADEVVIPEVISGARVTSTLYE
jgi:hypothetical protein